MKLNLRKLIALSVASVLVFGGVAVTQMLVHFASDGSSYLFGKDSAAVVSKQIILMDRPFTNACFSPDGEFAYVSETHNENSSEPKGPVAKQTAVLVNLKSGKFKTLFQISGSVEGGEAVAQEQWLPTGHTLVFLDMVMQVTKPASPTAQPEVSYARSVKEVNPETFEIRTVCSHTGTLDFHADTPGDGDSDFAFSINPVTSDIYVTDSGAVAYHLNGTKTVLPKRFPSAEAVQISSTGQPYREFHRKGKAIVYEVLSPGNEMVETAVAPTPFMPKVIPPSVQLAEGASNASGAQAKVSGRSYWLADLTGKYQSRLLLTYDGDASIGDSGSAVVYSSGGVTFLRLIRKVPSEELAALLQAEKARALSQAKQMGLGLIMYSNDWDDQLPIDISTVYPYIKNQDLMNGFSYLHSGGYGETGVASPADTVLGQVSTVGGTAIVYYDGHAKWSPN